MRAKLELKKLLLITAMAVLPTLAIWAPFFLNTDNVMGVPIPAGGMATVVSNYDGPLYLVVAKTLYNTEAIKNSYSFDLPVEYYAAHFPLYPLLIRGVALVLGTYPYSMLLITVISSIICLFFFYKLATLFVKDDQALWLTFIFSGFPARFLIVRSVGSPEPLFIGAIIASIYYFHQKKYWLAGIWGAIAQLTKSPAILLFIAYMAAVVLPPLKHAAQTSTKNIFKKVEWRAYPVLLIPFVLLLVFALFKLTMNDFLAYFHSGDNIHLFFPPFQIFNYSQPWVGTFWLEEIIFIYLFSLLGISELVKQKKYTLLAFCGVFFVTSIFVSHRDLLRYSLPLVPFLYIGFAQQLLKKEFRYIILFLLIPVYLFSLAYISQNFMQISDWGPLL